MQRYELSGGTSSKFWEIEVDGAVVTVRFGRIGTAGQTQRKAHASPEAARQARDKLVAEKTKKGYRSAAAAKAKSAPAAKAKPAPARPLADGAPKDVVALRKLAARAQAEDEAETEPLVRTYILALAKGKPGVMRAGGPPIGVTAKTRPTYGGKLMHHLITLDLDALPALRAQHAVLAKARAVALFISDARDNEAFDKGTKETAVVKLRPEDIARGAWAGPDAGDPKPSALAAWPVDVPARVFTFDRYGDGVEDADPLAELHDELMSACRAGGPVLHWSGDAPDPRWLFQLNEDLVEVNLGDAGTMYVFTDHAYWSGH